MSYIHFRLIPSLYPTLIQLPVLFYKKRGI